jgi:hypothetical protein
MTDVLSRPAVVPPEDEDPGAGGAADRSPSPGPVADGPSASWPWSTLASLLVAAGAIHLAMAPVHARESVVEGVGFALAGWSQIALAVLVLVLVRTRPVGLRVAAAVNVVLVGLWVVSRTVGLPVGASAGHAETVGFVDGLCVAFEVIAAAAALAVAVRPAPPARTAGSRPGGPGLVPAVVAPLAVVALATAAIALPGTADHSHATAATGGGDPAHAMDMAGMDHGRAAAAPADDKGFSTLSDGHGAHHGGAEEPLDPETQKQLSHQLAITQTLATRYPTVADAEAAGYHRAGPFGPGLGVHYYPSVPPPANTGLITDEELLHPLLIFKSQAPDAPIVGYMYVVTGVSAAPEGFAGPNDHWHYHTNACLTTSATGEMDIPIGIDRDVTQEQCEAVGGKLMPLTGYMVHVWTVPGWENPNGGAFAELNPKLTCRDGTYWTIPVEKIGANGTICRDEAVIRN